MTEDEELLKKRLFELGKKSYDCNIFCFTDFLGLAEQSVFAMQVGEITKEPVKTQFGYHLIKLNSKKESEAIEFSAIKDEIKDGLLGEKRRAAYDSKINQLKILYPVDMMI